MQTSRGRLTVWYSAALVLTLAAFAIVLYVARRRASYEDLDQRIRSEAELSAAILGESYRSRGVLVTYDSTGKPALVADIKAVLEAVPDYLLITAQDGEILYSSSNASLTYQQVVQLRKLTPPPLSGRTAGTVRLEPDGPELRYVAHIVSGAGPRFGSLLVAADVRTAELAVAQLLSTLLLIVPIGLIAAILVGSWIARGALEPVDRIISEVREETLQEIKRVSALVDALLTLARADEGIAPLHLEPVDLRAILEEARETGELLAEQAGVQMDLATPPEPVIVPVDASRIRQLILNLVTNAVKYTPSGGSVRMQLGQANGRVTLTVADTGIGIAAGDLPHIFDRFWRADSARTRTGERPGAGLGLAICKWIAEAHGGTIEVQSRPGRGTTFTVTLPKEAAG